MEGTALSGMRCKGEGVWLALWARHADRPNRLVYITLNPSISLGMCTSAATWKNRACCNIIYAESTPLTWKLSTGHLADLKTAGNDFRQTGRGASQIAQECLSVVFSELYSWSNKGLALDTFRWCWFYGRALESTRQRCWVLH